MKVCDHVSKFNNQIAIGHEKLKQYYYKRLYEMFTKRGKKMIFWSDAMYDRQITLLYVNPPKNSISQVWINSVDMLPYIWRGCQALLSSGWYLNYLDRGWKDFYNVEPFEYVEKEYQQQVLGGEA
jgi:N-acetyl-beta-hexosaminidase